MATEMSEQRRQPRTPISLKVRYRSGTVEEFAEQFSQDISRGGLFIQSGRPLPVGTMLKFELQLRDERSIITGVGRVAWCRSPEEATPHQPAGMGIKFAKMDDTSRLLIESLTASDRDPWNQNSTQNLTQPAKKASFFPDLPPAEQPPPEDRTAVRHATDLLAAAMAQAGAQHAHVDAENRSRSLRPQIPVPTRHSAAPSTTYGLSRNQRSSNPPVNSDRGRLDPRLAVDEPFALSKPSARPATSPAGGTPIPPSYSEAAAEFLLAGAPSITSDLDLRGMESTEMLSGRDVKADTNMTVIEPGVPHSSHEHMSIEFDDQDELPTGIHRPIQVSFAAGAAQASAPVSTPGFAQPLTASVETGSKSKPTMAAPLPQELLTPVAPQPRNKRSVIPWLIALTVLSALVTGVLLSPIGPNIIRTLQPYFARLTGDAPTVAPASERAAPGPANSQAASNANSPTKNADPSVSPAPVSPSEAAMPAPILIESVPSGAEIMFGTQRLGQTPVSITVPLQSEVQLSLPGYLPATLVTRSVPQLSATLAPKPWRIRVLSNPEGATITFRSRTEQTPDFVVAPVSRRETLRISMTGYRPFTAQVVPSMFGEEPGAFVATITAALEPTRRPRGGADTRHEPATDRSAEQTNSAAGQSTTTDPGPAATQEPANPPNPDPTPQTPTRLAPPPELE